MAKEDPIKKLVDKISDRPYLIPYLAFTLWNDYGPGAVIEMSYNLKMPPEILVELFALHMAQTFDTIEQRKYQQFLYNAIPPFVKNSLIYQEGQQPVQAFAIIDDITREASLLRDQYCIDRETRPIRTQIEGRLVLS